MLIKCLTTLGEVCGINKYNLYCKGEWKTKMKYYDKEVNIYEGLIVKNYKEMCQLLDEKITDGNSKKSQLNNWKRYFDFQKDGQKFVILKVYDKPFPTDEARQKREGIYIRYIECLLMRAIAQSSTNGILIVTQSNLYRELGMVNDRYSEYYKAKLKKRSCEEVDDGDNHIEDAPNDTEENNQELKHFISQVLERVNSKGKPYEQDIDKMVVDGNIISKVNEWNIYTFYQAANRKLKTILVRALTSMQSRKLINYNNNFQIVRKTGRKNRRGKDILESVIANPDEMQAITDIQRQAIIRIGCRDVFEISYKHKWKEYQNTIDEITQEQYPDWVFFYPVYVITHCNDLSAQTNKDIADIKKMTTIEQQEELNKQVTKALSDMFQRKFENMESKYNIEEQRLKEEAEKNGENWKEVRKNKIENKELPFHHPYSWVVKSQLLIDDLVKITNDKDKDNNNEH